MQCVFVANLTWVNTPEYAQRVQEMAQKIIVALHQKEQSSDQAEIR